MSGKQKYSLYNLMVLIKQAIKSHRICMARYFMQYNFSLHSRSNSMVLITIPRIMPKIIEFSIYLTDKSSIHKLMSYTLQQI